MYMHTSDLADDDVMLGIVGLSCLELVIFNVCQPYALMFALVIFAALTSQ